MRLRGKARVGEKSDALGAVRGRLGQVSIDYGGRLGQVGKDRRRVNIYIWVERVNIYGCSEGWSPAGGCCCEEGAEEASPRPGDDGRRP